MIPALAEIASDYSELTPQDIEDANKLLFDNRRILSFFHSALKVTGPV